MKFVLIPLNTLSHQNFSLFPPWPLVLVLRNSFPQSLQAVCFPGLSVWPLFQVFERYLLSMQKPLWFDQVVMLWLFIFSKSLVFLISSHMYSGFLDSFQALSKLLTFKILPPRYFSYIKSAFCQCSISNLEKQPNVFLLLFFISTMMLNFLEFQSWK